MECSPLFSRPKLFWQDAEKYWRIQTHKYVKIDNHWLACCFMWLGLLLARNQQWTSPEFSSPSYLTWLLPQLLSARSSGPWRNFPTPLWKKCSDKAKFCLLCLGLRLPCLPLKDRQSFDPWWLSTAPPVTVRQFYQQHLKWSFLPAKLPCL